MKTTTHYKGHRWTIEELKLLMKMWADDESLTSIAAATNATECAISKQIVRMRKEGIPLKRRTKGHVAGRTNQLWTQAEVEYLLRRRAEKATAEQIASDLERSFLAVCGMIQRLRKEDVPIAMLGMGVRRLWNANTLRGTIASSQTLHIVKDEAA